MFRRRRPLMRAAVVGGAGYAVGKRVEERRERQAGEDVPPDELDPYEEPADGTPEDTIGQLERLGQLRDSGVLTDAEFEEQKQKLLERT